MSELPTVLERVKVLCFVILPFFPTYASHLLNIAYMQFREAKTSDLTAINALINDVSKDTIPSVSNSTNTSPNHQLTEPLCVVCRQCIKRLSRYKEAKSLDF